MAGPIGKWSNNRMRRWYAFTWVVLSAGGCQGGQSGDPGFDTGELGGNEVPPEADCQVLARRPGREGLATFECKRAPSNTTPDENLLPAPGAVLWDCDCAGSSVPALADSCDGALLLACEVDAAAPQACDSSLGACAPDKNGGSSWDCRCHPGSAFPDAEVPAVVAANCAEAIVTACEERCEDETGSCFGAPASYTCACDAAGPLVPGPQSSSNPTCGEALLEVCGGACETEAGRCVLDGDVYDCSCADATSFAVDVSELGEGPFFGNRMCEAAVARSCGEVTYAESCNSSNGVWSSTCEALPYVVKPGEPAPGVVPFACTCEEGESSGEGSSEQTNAPTCAEALTAVCPEAIRPGSEAEGPTLDYGHLCDSDDDCSGNDCYVPGTRKDAVCSKHCETDADCPAFAQCASMFGSKHCFVTCTDDDACRQLNGAVENPLHCLSDAVLKLSHDGVCVQESEP